MQNNGNNGDFSKNLMSLELQLKTLIDGCGGENAIKLLDKLSALSRSERQVALRVFNRVTELLERDGERFLSREDEADERFVNNLYNQIVVELRDAERGQSSRRGVLRAVDGGRNPNKVEGENQPIDLFAARERQRQIRKNLLN